MPDVFGQIMNIVSSLQMPQNQGQNIPSSPSVSQPLLQFATTQTVDEMDDAMESKDGKKSPKTAVHFLEFLYNSPLFPDHVLFDLLQIMLDSLTIPDMLKLISGDWTPLEAMHPMLRNRLIEGLHGDESDANLEVLVDNLASSVMSALSLQNLPQVGSTFLAHFLSQILDSLLSQYLKIS